MINHDQYTEPVATDDKWDDELADSAKHIGAMPCESEVR